MGFGAGAWREGFAFFDLFGITLRSSQAVRPIAIIARLPVGRSCKHRTRAPRDNNRRIAHHNRPRISARCSARNIRAQQRSHSLAFWNCHLAEADERSHREADQRCGGEYHRSWRGRMRAPSFALLPQLNFTQVGGGPFLPRVSGFSSFHATTKATNTRTISSNRETRTRRLISLCLLQLPVSLPAIQPGGDLSFLRAWPRVRANARQQAAHKWRERSERRVNGCIIVAGFPQSSHPLLFANRNG